MQPKAMINRLATDHPDVTEAGSTMVKDLLSRSAVDREFRNRLLSEPRAALAEFSGKSESDIPAWFNVSFVENTGDMTIVLPPPAQAEAELSEHELETVAGGITPIASILSVVASLLEIYDWSVDDHHCTGGKAVA